MSGCLDENAALELLDGMLRPGARADVERHLEECGACRELVAELARDVGGGAAGLAEEPTVDTERTPGQRGELPIGITAGPYRIEHAIGSGSAGTVYRAIDVRTQQIVALKYVTDPALRARFGQEAQILARLGHDAIVRYIGHGEALGGMYLAMEWLEGEDLEARFRRGPLGWQEAHVLALRLSSALAHAHGLGCVHRDVSPRNIFLPEGRLERAKLLDFGLVRVEGGPLARTATHAVLGTPFYMSPEQIRDPKSVTARSDLFGLGVLLYEAVAGARPFQGDDLFSVWTRIVESPAPDLRASSPQFVPGPFVQLISLLLSKEPDGRPSSAAEVLARLERMSADGIAPTAPMAPPIRSAPPPMLPPRFAEAPPPQLTHPPVAPTTSAPPGPVRALSAPPRRAPHEGIYVAVGVACLFVAIGVSTVAYAFLRRPSSPIVITTRPAGSTRSSDEPPEPQVDKATPAVQIYPVTCETNATIDVTGNWEGSGPILAAVGDNCTIHITGAVLKGSTLMKTRAANVELVLDRVTVETTDITIRSGPNLTVRAVDSKVRGNRGVIETDGTLALTLEKATEVASEAGIAIKVGSNLVLDAQGGKITGLASAIVASSNAKIDGEGVTISSRKGSSISLGPGANLHFTNTTVLSAGDRALHLDTGGEVTLVNTNVEGAEIAIEGDNGLVVKASDKTRIVAKRREGISATTNSDVALNDASVEAEGIAFKSTQNTKVKLSQGARLVGKRGGIAFASNFQLEGSGATIDGGTGAGIGGGTNSSLVFRQGQLKGVPAVQLPMKPLSLDLEGTRVDGAQVLTDR